MKVLVVGDWLADIYEQAIYDGFSRNGCDVDKFSWIQYFKYYQYPGHFNPKKNLLFSLYYRFQNRFTFGPVIKKINNDLIKKVKCNEYDLIFIYRGTHIFPETLKKIKTSGAVIFGYNNDDPFSSCYPKYFWRHYLRGTFYYDHIYCYREKNIIDYKKLNFHNTSILRSYFIQEKNFPVFYNLVDPKYLSDVVFVGHFENDGRDKIILNLMKSGLNVKLYGTGWGNSDLIHEIEAIVGPIMPVYQDYNEVLNGAKIALVFLSKKNNDTYTRRVFEIAAAKTAMLSERTKDMESLFLENNEIEFFESSQDCLDKVRLLLDNNHYVDIAENAFERLFKDGHSVVDRVGEILSNEILNNEKNN